MQFPNSHQYLLTYVHTRTHNDSFVSAAHFPYRPFSVYFFPSVTCWATYFKRQHVSMFLKAKDESWRSKYIYSIFYSKAICPEKNLTSSKFSKKSHSWVWYSKDNWFISTEKCGALSCGPQGSKFVQPHPGICQPQGLQRIPRTVYQCLHSKNIWKNLSI